MLSENIQLTEFKLKCYASTKPFSFVYTDKKELFHDDDTSFGITSEDLTELTNSRTMCYEHLR